MSLNREIAAYETPVSERMWNMTVTPNTPDLILTAVLTALACEDAWDTALGSPVTSKHITQATRPLTEVGWASAVDGRWLRWHNDAGDAGVQFDAFAAQNPKAPLHTWTLWAGPSIDHPTWAIHALPHDFAPWETAYGYFAAWQKEGTFDRLNGLLRRLVREAEGRDAEPSACVLYA
ncbi:DUF317 domain-containing protein [Streptomyces sp. NPDC048281]|uniref:DUF317 domain-containing protein n=1 Tax=Streptomyces sp. NPDC048281 TaxID=3154715 RepID=UPI003429084D